MNFLFFFFFRILVNPVSWVFVHIFARLLLLNYAEFLQGDDGARYLATALNLLDHRTFSYCSPPSPEGCITSAMPAPTAHDMPLFPFWLATLILFSEDTKNAVFLSSFFNCFFFGLTCWAVYLLSWKLFKKASISLVAVIIFGFFPETFPYTLFYMPDILFLAFFTYSLLFLVIYFQTLEKKYLVILSFLFSFSVLTKPIGFPFVFIFSISILTWFFVRKEILRGMQMSVVFIILFSAIISPWIIRNFVTFGQVGISSISGSNLFYHNYYYLLQDKYLGKADSLFKKKLHSSLKGLSTKQSSNPMIVSSRLGFVAKEEILSNLTAYLQTNVKRHPRLYIGTGTTSLFKLLGDEDAVLELKQLTLNQKAFFELSLRVFLVQSISWVILAILYLACLFGTIKLVTNKKWKQLFVLFGVTVVFMAIIGPIAYTRYRFVLLPTLSILAAYGFSNFFYQQKNRNK